MSDLTRGAGIKAAVAAAARKLSLSSDTHQSAFGDPIEVFADMIVTMTVAGGAQKISPHPDVERKTVETELEKLSTYAIKLKSAIDGMSVTTKQCLWDAKTIKLSNGSYVRANVNDLLSSLRVELEVLKQIAGTAPATVAEHFKAGGRPPDLRVAAITKVTAHHFRKLTGLEPDRSNKPTGFQALLKAVFDAVGIKASAERATKDLIAETRT